MNLTWWSKRIGLLAGASAPQLGSFVKELTARGDACFELSATAMQSRGHIFEHLAKRLRFPDYVEINWGVLKECLGDLEWIEGKGVVIIIRDAAKLVKIPQADRAFLLAILGEATEKSLIVDEGAPERYLTVFFADSEQGLRSFATVLPELTPSK